ncbi:hypothetical protein DMA11_13700 [Marinilabiliaceae bacterium JC017]|nr:hypothetical protein DMA11_13700 [Marinilabiliaceae bacterium JC017]
MSKYTEIYRIILNHDFFEKNQCRGVNITPDEESLNYLYNLGLFFKRISVNEWGLFVQKDELQKEKLLLWLEKDYNTLGFNIEVCESDFFLFTDWPGYSPKQFYLFMPGSEAEELLVSSGKLRYGVIPEENVILPKQKAIRKIHKRIIGLLKLSFSKKILDKFWQDEGNQSYRIMIQFHSLKVFWEFVLIPRNYSEDQSLMIKEATESLQFTELEKKMLLSKQQAYRGLSSDLIPLKERYDYKVQVWETKKTGKRLIAAEVPLPMAGEFSLNTSRDKVRIVTKYFYF